MSDWQQLMTLAVKNLPPAAGWRAEPRLNNLSVAIWIQHLAVIYAKAEKLLQENVSQVQQLAAIYII